MACDSRSQSIARGSQGRDVKQKPESKPAGYPHSITPDQEKYFTAKGVGQVSWKMLLTIRQAV